MEKSLELLKVNTIWSQCSNTNSVPYSRRKSQPITRPQPSQPVKRRSNWLEEIFPSNKEDISNHEQLQEGLANELLQMTRSLKRNMVTAGDVIREDNKRLIKMSQMADNTKDQFQTESSRFAYHASCWSFDCIVIMLTFFLFWSFFIMLLVIKFCPKKLI